MSLALWCPRMDGRVATSHPGRCQLVTLFDQEGKAVWCNRELCVSVCVCIYVYVYVYMLYTSLSPTPKPHSTAQQRLQFFLPMTQSEQMRPKDESQPSPLLLPSSPPEHAWVSSTSERAVLPVLAPIHSQGHSQRSLWESAVLLWLAPLDQR